MPTSRDDRKPTSWTARVLAPVVLVAVAAAIVLVISGTLTNDDQSNDKTAGGSQTTSSGCNPAADQAVKEGFYVVTADDVQGLSGIADKTCISVEQLIALNPNLDPQALQVDNCVDLIPDGCKALASG
ncbi:MAG: hypothetical protein QOI10_510 [Solirubrobacterales bacterium]|jgi:hypothetical protein|nr:hypothetical protein [Solirubrobacterales bacterium]